MSQMVDQFNAWESKTNLHQLQKMHEKTLLDGNFQRWGGVNRGSGWSVKDGRSYVTNFLRGATFNSIINVSAKSALQYCQRQEVMCQKSIAYFTKVIADGYEYISIDGNNSASYLTSFISGNPDIKVKIRNSENEVSFDQLHTNDRDEIRYTEKINVVTLRDITVDEMCDLFRQLNTSTKLNNQEWRQARISDLSQAIRDYGNNNKDFFTYSLFSNAENLDKRFHEEMIAATAIKISTDFHTRSTNKAALDAFYENNYSLDSKVIRRLNQIFSSCSSIVQTLDTPLKSKLKKGEVMTLFDVIDIISEEQKFDIVNFEEFFNWFLKKNAEFIVNSKNVRASELESKSYEHWVKFWMHKNNWNNIRKLFTCAFIEDAEYLFEKKVIKIKRTSNDKFSLRDKLELMHLQNNKTRNGDKIKVLDLYLGKYEADHVKPVCEGGLTQISNGELMTLYENRKKGANTNVPYFDYQK